MANRQPTLFVAVSSHGFGHLAQTAPVINALWQRVPDLQVVVQMAAPKALLSGYFDRPFEHLPVAADVGMVMSSSLDVRVEESAAAYLEFHRDWQEKVDRQAEILRRYRADLVLANIPYLLPAAAQRCRIPAVALCSLNWRDICEAYCGGRRELQPLFSQMEESYRAAELFLQPLPSMVMEWLPNRKPIGPIARRGRSRRREVEKALGLNPGDKVVLLAFGGIASPFPLERWPRFPGIHFVVSGHDVPQRPGFHSLDVLEMSYIDVLCSVDVLLTKPGYGSFSEAACNGVPVMYVPREGWPEAAYLVAWLQEILPCREIGREAFEEGDFVEQLVSLCHRPPVVPVEPTGIEDAVESLSFLLRS